MHIQSFERKLGVDNSAVDGSGWSLDCCFHVFVSYIAPYNIASFIS